MPENPGTCLLHGLADCTLCRPAAGVLPLRIPGGIHYGPGMQYRIVPDGNGWIFYPYATEFTAGRQQLREAERGRQEEYARARAKQEAARAAAWAKAEQTLLRWLSPAQEHDYRAHRWFDVTGSDGRRWRIQCAGQTGNVHLLDSGSIHAFCAHPRGLPDPAAWLTQAMAVAHDAAGFLRTANFYGTVASEEAVAVAGPGTGRASAFEGLATALQWPLRAVPRYLARELPPV